MSASSQNARRRQSYIEVAVNPIDSKLDVGEAEFQLESLTDATQISKMDLNTLISMLTEKRYCALFVLFLSFCVQ